MGKAIMQAKCISVDVEQQALHRQAEAWLYEMKTLNAQEKAKPIEQKYTG